MASFAEKARRTRDGVPLYTDPLREITDTIGIRVITYVHSDVSAVADLLRDQVVVHDDRDMGQETAQEGRFGYASRHLLIGLDAAREGHPVLRADARAHGAGADPHGAAARVGGVRARHPLQGHDAGRARPRLRPPVHPGGRSAGAGRPGVLHDPRHPARLGSQRHGDRRRTRRRPAHRPARARGVPGRAVRRGRLVAHRPLRVDLRVCSSSSGSPPWTSSARPCAPATRS